MDALRETVEEWKWSRNNVAASPPEQVMLRRLNLNTEEELRVCVRV